MPLIEIRTQLGVRSPQDLIVTVQDKTYDFLMAGAKEDVRASTYLDRDWPRVEPMYAELFVSDSCPFQYHITRITPGSKTRWTVTLPDEMKEGEQITVHARRVDRTERPA